MRDGSLWTLNQGDTPNDTARMPDSMPARTSANTSRRMAAQWLGALRFMADQYPTVLTNADLVNWGRENGYGFSKHALRATLYGWRGRGYVEAVQDGQHRITTKGATAVGRALKSIKREDPTDEAGPSLEFGGG